MNLNPDKPMGAEWERRLLAMHGVTDSAGFIQAVFALLNETVQCDFVLANLRNVERVPLVARDSLGREFGVEYMERFFKLNPSVPYVLTHPGIRLLPTRGHLPEGDDLRALPFYQECMKPFGWRYSVALFFWGLLPPVPQNVFCVFRSEDQEDFNDDDLARLRFAHSHIATALKRLRKQLKDRSTHDGMAELLEHLPVAVTLLDWDLRIGFQSKAARRLVAQWTGQGNETLLRTRSMPNDVLVLCRALKEDWREALRADPKAHLTKKLMLAHPNQPTLRAEVSLIAQQDAVLANPGFLIQMDSTAPETARLDSPLHLLAALTEAEREASLLAAGALDNQEIAERLGIGVAAVKLRLHGAFKKLNVRSRAQLMISLRPAGIV